MPISTIKPTQLYDEIESLLDEYGDEIVEKNEEAIRSVAKEVTKDLRKAGSFGGTGKYRKAINYEMRRGRLTVEAKIGAERPHYRLTHLLEFGHAKQNGGRTTAYNFVAPINNTIEERYVKKMEELLNK